MGEQLQADAIQLYRNGSVNRSKYSEPEDVLVPCYQQYGIACFTVGDILPHGRTTGGTLFEFRVVHDPLQDNYAHSEIRTFKNGQHDKRADAPGWLKLEFRARIAESAVLIRRPQT